MLDCTVGFVVNRASLGGSVMLYLIKTTTENRAKVANALHPLGTVVDQNDDGSFKFRFYDSHCVDDGMEELARRDVKVQLLRWRGER